MHYEPVIFDAVDSQEKTIYHTNVMMAMIKNLVVICLSSILEPQRAEIIKILQDDSKTIIDISQDQVNHFCGNILYLEKDNGDGVIAMSSKAKASFSEGQLQLFRQVGQIVDVSIDTIEQIGGGGVRCMLAENYFSQKAASDQNKDNYKKRKLSDTSF